MHILSGIIIKFAPIACACLVTSPRIFPPNDNNATKDAIPIVIPRAHDCITLLMGSKEKYANYFSDNAGTYYHSSGWLERNQISEEMEGSISQKLGYGKSYDDYIEEYGEENADYIVSMIGNWLVNYNKVAFINNGIGDIADNREISKEFAKSNKWEFEEVEGSINLIEKLINGEWDESDFLIVPPNHKIEPTNDLSIITHVPANS